MMWRINYEFFVYRQDRFDESDYFGVKEQIRSSPKQLIADANSKEWLSGKEFTILFISYDRITWVLLNGRMTLMRKRSLMMIFVMHKR